MSNEEPHAKYAPSAAARWLNCPGSIPLSEKVGEPGRTSKYAEEGTECHEAAARILNGDSGDDFDNWTIGLSEEQTDIIRQYVDYCSELMARLSRKFGHNVKCWIEQRGRAPYISPDFHGTADFVIHAGSTLGVVDLKTGYVPVEIERNEQLLSYAVLALEQHELWDRVKEVRMTIIQPRVFDKPQTWTVPIGVLDYFKARVRARILVIEDGLNILVPGPYCKYCPARGRCPALRQEVIKRAQIDFEEPREARDYEAEELGLIAKEAEFIQAHLDGVMQQLRSMLERGRKVPGWKLVPKRAVSKWTDFEGFLQEMPEGEREQFFIAKPMTPNQVKARLTDGDWDVDLTPFYVKESSGTTLAKDSDPRNGVQHDPFGDN